MPVIVPVIVTVIVPVMMLVCIIVRAMVGMLVCLLVVVMLVRHGESITYRCADSNGFWAHFRLNLFMLYRCVWGDHV